MASDDNEVDMVKVGDLTQYSRKVYTVVKVISMTEEREVTSRSDMSTHRVAEALVADDTGSVYLTLWDDILDQIEDDQILNIKDAYVNLFRGSMRLNLGRYGSYELLDEAPFDDVNLDNNLSSKVFERQPRNYDRGRGRGYGRGQQQRRRY
jgi:replication factor A1